MTAEEFRKINNIEGEFTAYTKDGKRFDMHIDEFAEQYAQAKVLEALEGNNCEFCNSKVVPNMYCCSNCSESGMIKNTTKLTTCLKVR